MVITVFKVGVLFSSETGIELKFVETTDWLILFHAFMYEYRIEE